MDGTAIHFDNSGANVALPRAAQRYFKRSEAFVELRSGPIPAVLDTCCVRTGLAYQLANKRPPASIAAAQTGTIRMFMERETLAEAWERLPRFADQLAVPLQDLQRLFADEWLPCISVVSLTDALRELDPRARLVHDLDPDDLPAAALAALLSPCILLTHDHTHFRPLGIEVREQGVNAALATFRLRDGEMQVQAVAMLPAVPALAVVGGVKQAADRVGPAAWLVLGLLILGASELYRRQPAERRERIKDIAATAGRFLLDEHARATAAVHEAQDQLIACVVPAPPDRTPTAAVVRHLATTDDSMSAEQLCAAVKPEERPAVAALRGFMRANKDTMFDEVRRGGFVLGRRYA